jgi:ubiquinone biosynthesis protein Coq4
MTFKKIVGVSKALYLTIQYGITGVGNDIAFEISDSLIHSLSQDEIAQNTIKLKTSLPIESAQFSSANITQHNTYTLEDLNGLPDGTLGKEYYRFMKKNGYDPEFWPEPAVPRTEPLGNITAHLRKNHDFIHVLTGYNTDVAGEAAIQVIMKRLLPEVKTFTFLYLATWLHTNVFHIFTSNRARYSNFTNEAKVLAESIFTTSGLCLIDQRLYEQMETPVSTLRAQFGITTTQYV